jgi:hypothetical protein
MKDGWAVDTSLNWPRLDRVLEDSEKIIADRSSAAFPKPARYRSFPGCVDAQDAETYPSFLDFVTSSDVLATVSDYLKFTPALVDHPAARNPFCRIQCRF